MITYNILLQDGASLPKRANETDTGYDLVALDEPKIVGTQLHNGKYSHIDYLEYKTGVKLGEAFNDGHDARTPVYTLLFPRSSLSKYNLLLCNSIGLVDSGYRGELLLRFKYVFQPMDLDIMGGGILSCCINPSKIYHKGDKIAQMVPMHLLSSIQFNQVNDLDATARGTGGFGSSDNKTN